MGRTWNLWAYLGVSTSSPSVGYAGALPLPRVMGEGWLKAPLLQALWWATLPRAAKDTSPNHLASISSSVGQGAVQKIL